MAYDENIRVIAEELERVKNRPTGDKLPDVEITDEGKVLTVNSSGEWDAEDLPDQLPAVESTDEGKVLTVNSAGKWEAATIPAPTSDVEIVQYTIDSITTASYGWIEPVPDENGNPLSTNDDIIDMTLLTTQNYVKFMPTRANVNGVATWIAKSFSVNTMAEVTSTNTYTGLKITILRHKTTKTSKKKGAK